MLAAGLSTRFGRNKLLEPIDSTPLIRHVVANAVASQASEVIVVLGHQAAEVRRALRGLRCRFVVNRQYRAGQSFSVRVGLSMVSPDMDAILVLPGDAALVKTTDINSVVQAYAQTKALVVVAAFRRRPGHPILFGRRLFPRLHDIDEASQGLKAVVVENAEAMHVVDVGSQRVLLDVDTRAEFARYFGCRPA